MMMIPPIPDKCVLTEADMKNAKQRGPTMTGAKNDRGKPAAGQMLAAFRRALSLVAKRHTEGGETYGMENWLTVEAVRYEDALGRHLLRLGPDTERGHRVAVAWNALASLELYLREQNDTNEIGKLYENDHSDTDNDGYPPGCVLRWGSDVWTPTGEDADDECCERGTE